MYRLISVYVILIVLLAGAGCASLRSDEVPEISDAETLRAYLDDLGIGLMYEGPFAAPAMTVPGHAFTVVTGGTLMVFNYPTGADALAATTSARLDQSAGRTDQLYRSDELVVVYRGDDSRVERALIRAMGSPR
jgi:hypothetical protein